MSKILELFTVSTSRGEVDWGSIADDQHCSYLEKKCVKSRKSDPDQSIGTCSVTHGAKEVKGLIICPHRFE